MAKPRRKNIRTRARTTYAYHCSECGAEAEQGIDEQGDEGALYCPDHPTATIDTLVVREKSKTAARKNSPGRKFSEFDADFVVEHEQYYQGCGSQRFDSSATGIGDSADSSLHDALDSVAQQEDLPESEYARVVNYVKNDLGAAKFTKIYELNDEHYVYCCFKYTLE